jgi:hypothetical protein
MTREREREKREMKVCILTTRDELKIVLFLNNIICVKKKQRESKSTKENMNENARNNNAFLE